MSALVKRRILLTDCDGFVSKREVRTALMRLGISGKVARETTDGNFDHLPGDDDAKRLNLFAMNTISGGTGGDAPGGAIEHFRSTGIRDTADGPDAARYALFVAHAASGTGPFAKGYFTQTDVSRAIATFDVDAPHPNVYGELVHSNDVNTDHPKRRDGACAPAASVRSTQLVTGEPQDGDACLSNLHGSIVFMFQEMGTPTGPNAKLTATEMRALWLQSDLPQGLLDRSPLTCEGGAHGCASCWDAYAAAPDAASFKRTLRARYCRCMMIPDFLLSGGFGPNATTMDVALPGVLASSVPEYASTCQDEHDASQSEMPEHMKECFPYCFADGTPADGHFWG